MDKRHAQNATSPGAAASELTRRLEPFGAELLVYIETGGRTVGRKIADALGVQALGLTIRYPASARFNRLGPLGRALGWPLKEAIYRLASPRLHTVSRLPLNVRKIALFDDSASSGKTLQLALEWIQAAGLSRKQVAVAVVRCGKRARPLVDEHITSKRIRVRTY